MMERTSSWNLIASLGLVFVVVTFLVHSILDRSEEDALDNLIGVAQETGAPFFIRLTDEVLSGTMRVLDPAEPNPPTAQDELVTTLETWHLGSRIFSSSAGSVSPLLEDIAPIIERVGTREGEVLENEPLTSPEVRSLQSVFQKIRAELESNGLERLAAVRTDFVSRGQAKNAIFFVILTVASGLIVMTLLQNNWLLAANAKISENAQMYSRLARRDSLTGLANRLHFEEILSTSLKAWDEDETLAVLALDLDGFKAVNDTLGHDGGDALLKSIAGRLKNIVRNLDSRNVVARTGGDEFVILLHLQTGVADPRRIASRLCSELQRPFETEFGHIKAGGSVGYTIVSSEHREPAVLLTEADLALMDAKRSGTGASRAFNPSMMDGLKRRLKIETDLETAIERRHILPFYQPQFDLSTGRLIGAEALARWNHPDFGQVTAEEFIPIAEASGDIVKLGKIILEQACADAAQMRPDLMMTVNVSLAQLVESDFVSFVRDALLKYGLPASRLTLEIQEQALLSDPFNARHVLSSLQALGVQISLGDFGTGAGRIRDILQIRWNEIKVDKSLSMLDDMSGATDPIVDVIQQIGTNFKSNLIVEGIETEKQKNWFSSAGFAIGQGYFYSEALPREDFENIFLAS